MSTLAIQAVLRSPPGLFSNVVTIARREFRDATRSRWFILYTAIFAALGLGVSYISAASTGVSGLDGFSRTSAGLINLVLLVVPLMGLTAGAGTISSDRERGMLAYLLAQPVSRLEVLLGKYVGLAAALTGCVCLGLGACAGVLAWRGAEVQPLSVLFLAGLTVMLALAMLSVGMAISVFSRRSSVATGAAIFGWLVFTLVSDLGLLAGTLALRLRVGRVFSICVGNPVQVFKMWALQASGASLDVLGPAGVYGLDRFGDSITTLFAVVLVAWIAGPLAFAAVVFSRRSPL